jgi:LacI family transcriptional regulator
VHSVTNPTIAALVNGAPHAAREAGYAVLVCAIENDRRLEATYLALLRRQRVAAVIAQPVGPDPAPYAALRRSGVAVVCVGHRPGDDVGGVVTPDHRGAVRDAVRHLFSSGRRRVALITGPRWLASAAERLAGYDGAHREAGLPVDEGLVLAPDGSRGATSAAAVTGLVRRRSPHERPDAVVAASAESTLAALSCLHGLGVAVPEEVALVGTGQIDWAPVASLPLSMLEIDGASPAVGSMPRPLPRSRPRTRPVAERRPAGKGRQPGRPPVEALPPAGPGRDPVRGGTGRCSPAVAAG